MLDDAHTIYNQEFFTDMPNRVAEWIDIEEGLTDSLCLIRVSDFRPDHHITVVMSDEKGQAIAYLEKDEKK